MKMLTILQMNKTYIGISTRSAASLPRSLFKNRFRNDNHKILAVLLRNLVIPLYIYDVSISMPTHKTLHFILKFNVFSSDQSIRNFQMYVSFGIYL